MKRNGLKHIAIVLCAVLTFMLSTVNAVAADDLRNNEMTQRQRDILMALGVEESELDSLTTQEIGQILIHGQLENDEYIRKYLPTEAELEADYTNYQNQISRIMQTFPDANLNRENVEDKNFL